MRSTQALIIGLGLTGATSPALAQHAYEGRAFVTAITRPCDTSSKIVERIGDEANLVYYPLIAGTQSGPEGLAFFDDGRSQILQPATSNGTLSGKGTYQGTKISADAMLFSFAGAYNLNITQVSSSVVTVSGTITNAWDVAGCTITFQAVLGPRVPI